MSEAIHIALAGEPVGKGRPRFGGGRVFTPARTRSYEAALRYAAAEQMRGRAPLAGPVSVTVQARMPIPGSWPKWKRAAARDGSLRAVGKPDTDNLLKVLDALNQIVFVDDAQIVSATVSKSYHEAPALLIWVEALSQARAA